MSSADWATLARARIARKATADVVIPDAKPKDRRKRTIGTPVKSNFR